MSEVYKESSCNCLVCETDFLFDPALTYRDKGLLATILALPDGCQTTFNDLCLLTSEKEKKLIKSWKKLHKLGYLVSTSSILISRDSREILCD